MKGRVLIVAGSDSGGGAGIQADIKTVTALGGYAMTAITALTAQNTLGVHAIHNVPASFVADQMRVVLDDIGADVIKIGMLHSAEVIEAVTATLESSAPNVPVVLDPVMIAKGGASLLQDAAQASLKAQLLPRTALLTPNVPEAEVLTGLKITCTDDLPIVGQSLMQMGPQAVLMKGGHLDGWTLSDVLLSASGTESFSSPRRQTLHTHGTGCTLASACAVGLAQDLDLVDAVSRARDYVQTAIRTAPGFGDGHGPLNHGHTLPK
jgi:hydroxymethylpyrimidine/phosphomethylpyrimidine kinase